MNLEKNCRLFLKIAKIQKVECGKQFYCLENYAETYY